MSVSHILKHKGRDVVTVVPEAKLKSVADTLAAKRIGAVVVADGKGKIVGILSERDIVSAVAKHGAGALDLAASAVMSAKVKSCGEDDSEASLMAMMTQNRIRHLPVVSDGKLAGMISIGDVVKFHIEAIEREAADMKAYIAGTG